MEVERTARATWSGDLEGGEGDVRRGSAPDPEPLTWRGRTEQDSPVTNPEELIAAAHAGCLSMTLTNVLDEAGYLLSELTVDAGCRLTDEDGPLRITAIDVRIRATVAGVSGEEFRGFVERAERACPVSNALRDNVVIRVDAELTAA